MAIKDKFFPSKQFVNVTGLITLKMRLKPGFVKCKACSEREHLKSPFHTGK